MLVGRPTLVVAKPGGVCALATSGQAAAPPRSLMNSRRFIALINRPMTACAA
jgi:hypothetical protein